MTIKNEHGVFAKPYSYNQCATVGCDYEVPSGLPSREWPEMAKSHVDQEHNGKSIWLDLLGVTK